MDLVVEEAEEVVAVPCAYFPQDDYTLYCQRHSCKGYIELDNDRMHVDNMVLGNDDPEVVDDSLYSDPKQVSEGVIVLEMGQVLDMIVRREEVLGVFQVRLAEQFVQIASQDHVVLVVPNFPNVLIDSDYVEPADQFGRAALEEHAY